MPECNNPNHGYFITHGVPCSCAVMPDPPPIPSAGWDELDCGGAFDGFQVTSDADPGL